MSMFAQAANPRQLFPGQPISFVPKATAEENYEAAQTWLANALRYEKEGKPAGHIDRGLNQACHYENAWYVMRSNFTRTN